MVLGLIFLSDKNKTTPVSLSLLSLLHSSVLSLPCQSLTPKSVRGAWEYNFLLINKAFISFSVRYHLPFPQCTYRHYRKPPGMNFLLPEGLFAGTQVHEHLLAQLTKAYILTSCSSRILGVCMEVSFHKALPHTRVKFSVLHFDQYCK